MESNMPSELFPQPGPVIAEAARRNKYKTQGGRAVQAGQDLKRAILEAIRKQNFYMEKWRHTRGNNHLFSDSNRCIVGRAYRNVFGGRSRLPVELLTRRERVAVTFQGQDESGSALEKMFYLAENAAMAFPTDIGEIWVVIDGEATLCAIPYMHTKIEGFSRETQRPMFLFSFAQFCEALASLLRDDSSHRLRKRIQKKPV